MSKMRMENINMFNDVLFKEFFKSIEARGIISRFLSAITGIPKDKFINALYITEELNTDSIEEKRKTTDIIVKIDDNNRLIVEMNQNYYKDLFETNTSYAFNVISLLTKHSENYSIKKVILINIDKFNHYNTDKPIIHFKLRDEDGLIENEMYNSIHLIIENVANSKYNVDEEIRKFSNLLKETSYKMMKRQNLGDEDYMAGIVKIEDLMKDIDKVGLLYDVEEQHKKALKGSYEYGVEQGIEQGIEQGKLESAKKLINSGMTIKEISKTLEIKEQTLKDYLNEYKK